jgi:hypothetical protein
MATKQSKGVVLADTIRDAYDVVQEAGSTRAEMQDALDKIADLCEEALPDLDENDSDDDEADDTE